MKYPAFMLLVIAAAVAGCGGGDSEPADDGTPAGSDAVEPWDDMASAGCDLVTDEEIMAALDEPVDAKEEGGYYGCRWQTASHRIELRVFATTSLPADSCAENQTSMPYGQSAHGQQAPVAGLGDSAIWGSSGDLLVCTGRGLLVVDYGHSPPTMSPADEKEVAIQVARHALGQLAGQ